MSFGRGRRNGIERRYRCIFLISLQWRRLEKVSWTRENEMTSELLRETGIYNWNLKCHCYFTVICLSALIEIFSEASFLTSLQPGQFTGVSG